jgi:membrane protease subunit HflK
MPIDSVISQGKGQVADEAQALLQDILDGYDAGLLVSSIELQEVLVPEAVRAAFDDVVGAAQDADRLVNQAEGYRNEMIPGARAEAVELIESASGYRDARIAESTGEAQRFSALEQAYRASPEVTRKRLYLEAMESVLPKVDKVIIEPGAAGVLPYLPLVRDAAGARR